MFRGFLDPIAIRAIAAVAVVAFLFPFFFNDIEFQHSLAGRMQSTFVIYDLPAISAFLILRLYTINKSNINPIFLFIGTWFISTILICNCICSPLFLDAILFLFQSPKFIYSIISFKSSLKIICSYCLIYKSVALYSAPAVLLVYGLFLAFCKLLPTPTGPDFVQAIGTIVRRIPVPKPSILAGGALRMRGYQFVMACLLAAIIVPLYSQNDLSILSYEQFQMADRDNDGTINPDEFKQWIERSADGANATIAFKDVDRNSDSKIGPAEWNQFFRQMYKSGKLAGFKSVLKQC